MQPPAVLTISSQVAAGPVGNSAIVPALLALGVTPIAVPTVMLSHHPGHGIPRGTALSAEVISEILTSLETMGFLAPCCAVLTGYFASAAQVAAVADPVRQLKERGAIYICDPVLGDDGALYVKEDVAAAIRDRLVPLADILMPNVFELGWLTGRAVSDAISAADAAAAFPGQQVIVTSVRSAPDEIATVLFGDGEPLALVRPKREAAPHGTGDLLSGLIAGLMALGLTARASLPRAIDTLEAVIATSDGNILNPTAGLPRR